MKNFCQFMKFALVGVSNTLISEGIYVLLVFCGSNYLLASFAGFVLSVLNAYFWSSRYVFAEDEDGTKRVWWKVLIKTYAAYAGGFLINAALLIFWIDVLQIHRYLGPVADVLRSVGWENVDAELVGKLLAEAVNLLLVVPLNYLVNKYWAYRREK